MVRVEVLEERPEVGDAMRDGLGMIGVRLATRESLFVAAAGGALPVRELVPVEAVEIPGDAVAEGAKVFEGEAVAAARGSGDRSFVRWKRDLSVIRCSASNGAEDLFAQDFGGKLAGVDVDIADGARVSRGTGTDLPGDGDGFAEVVLVLNPIEMHAEVRELPWLEMAFFEEGAKGLDDLSGGEGGGGFLGVVDLKDHGRSRRGIMGGGEGGGKSGWGRGGDIRTSWER